MKAWIGMCSYQHSADLAGNLIASRSGYATARDYAKLGMLYLNDGVCDNERLLPHGWVDYALTATHIGASYAASFRTNADRVFRICRRKRLGRPAPPIRGSSSCAATA